jgi:hypothetical protein
MFPKLTLNMVVSADERFRFRQDPWVGLQHKPGSYPGSGKKAFNWNSALKAAGLAKSVEHRTLVRKFTDS